MAESKRYYWMKLKEDIFTSKRMKKLRKLGADYVIIYLKMQLKAIRTDGILEITGIENSVADEIALEIDEDTDKVQVTLSFLQACGLIEVKDGDLFLPYAKENTGSESSSAIRGREFRARMTDEQKAKERERARIGMQKSRAKKKDVTNSYKQITNVEKEKEIEIDNIYINILSSSLDYLNFKTGKHFKTTTKKTRNLIKSRVSEGYTLEDFITVIDNKCSDWTDEKMQTYLRPETLFGSKFESYLNEKHEKKSTKKSGFNNFEQRENVDFSALEKKMLGG